MEAYPAVPQEILFDVKKAKQDYDDALKKWKDASQSLRDWIGEHSKLGDKHGLSKAELRKVAAFVDRLVKFANARAKYTQGWSYLLIWYARKQLEAGFRPVYEQIAKHLPVNDMAILQAALSGGWTQLKPQSGNSLKNIACRLAKEFRDDLSYRERKRWKAWILVIVPPIVIAAMATGEGVAQAADVVLKKPLSIKAAATSTAVGIKGFIAVAVLVSALAGGIWLARDCRNERSPTPRTGEISGITEAEQPQLPPTKAVPKIEDPLRSKCLSLQSGPEKRSCLIQAADTVRSDLRRAKELYDLAIKEPYDPTAKGVRKIEDGYVRKFAWGKEASGESLWKAQTFQALAGLSSLFALHREFRSARDTWDKAVQILKTDGHVFGPGPTFTEKSVKEFLDQEAGGQAFDLGNAYATGPMGQIQIRHGIRLFKAGQLLEALDELACGIDDLGNPIPPGVQQHGDKIEQLTGDDAAMTRYWAGIVPPSQNILAEGRQSTGSLIDQLRKQKMAIAEAGLIVWLRDQASIGVSAIEYPWWQTCRLANEKNDTIAWRWKAMATSSANGTQEIPWGPRDKVKTIPFPARTTKLTINLDLPGTAPFSRELGCGWSEANIVFCLVRGKASLRASDEPCE